MNLPNKPKILAATYNPVSRTKMISFLVDFPTVLLAELRTHRILTQGSLYEHMELDDFNMSANSARAIPHNKYLQKILDNPFVPIWTKQQKGMSGEIIEDIFENDSIWKSNIERSDFSSEFPNKVIDIYQDLINRGVHKQNANRLLAPFAWTTCILSGTEWDNFFELRCPKYLDPSGKVFKSKNDYRKNSKWSCWEGNESDEEGWQEINDSTAQPEFQVIAEMLYDLYQEAEWKDSEFENGSQYHIPFKGDIELLYKEELVSLCGGILGKMKGYDTEKYYKFLMLVSASMCAKLSYNTQENLDTLEKHLERANMLIEHKHAEPFSHQAIAMDNEACQVFTKSYLTKNKPNSINGSLIDKRGTVERYKDLYKVTEQGVCYNLKGFIPQRYIIENL